MARFRFLLVGVVWLLLALVTAPMAAASEMPSRATAAPYTFESQDYPAMHAPTTTELGLLATKDALHACGLDRLGRGASVQSSRTVTQYGFQGTLRAVNVVSSTGTARQPAHRSNGHLSPFPRWQVAAKGADEAFSAGKYLNDSWYKSTFPNRTQSVQYHLAQHGKGRTAVEYTRDAMDFFAQNQSLGKAVILRDGTAGIKIATKQPLPGGGVQKVGGYWTSDGRLVTFWD